MNLHLFFTVLTWRARHDHATEQWCPLWLAVSEGLGEGGTPTHCMVVQVIRYNGETQMHTLLAWRACRCWFQSGNCNFIYFVCSVYQTQTTCPIRDRLDDFHFSTSATRAHTHMQVQTHTNTQHCTHTRTLYTIQRTHWLTDEHEHAHTHTNKHTHTHTHI